MNQHTLDCFCQTCNRRITLEEVRDEVHKGHDFTPTDSAALQAVKSYLRSIGQGAGS